MTRSWLLFSGLLLSSVATAVPYAQQTSFGTPSPAIRAAQARTSVPASRQALPAPHGGRLESAAVSVAPFNELIPSWNVTGTATSPLTVEVRVRRQGGPWTR